MDASITINDFSDKYIKAIRTRLRSHRQIERHFTRYTIHFNNRPINSIKRNDFAEYAEHRQNQGVTTDSINIELAVYSAAINYAKKRWEIELNNPITGLYYPHKPGRLRYLEKQEAATLLQQARQKSTYLADFIELALNTGARKNELLQIQNKSIDLQRKILTIEAHTTKTGKRRYLPINQAAHNAIQRRQAYKEQNCPESPWLFAKRNGERIKFPDKAFNQATQSAGLENFTIHDLRHTFASWLVTEGVELIKV